jgi:hypothetical protein
MNARAWNLFVLAGLLGTLLVLPATSHAAPPTTLTAYMKASDVSTPVPPPPAPGQVDQRQVVYISLQVYVDSNNHPNFLGIGTPLTPTTCGDACATRRVVTRKLGPIGSAFATTADVVGTKAFVDTASRRNYVITSVASSCSIGTVKVTLQILP